MKKLAALLLGGVIGVACSGTSSNSMPLSPMLPSNFTTMTGTWTGTSTDSTGQDSLSWTVAQSGANLTGTTSVSDSAIGMMGSGTMNGTVNGQALTFHMAVPSGGFSGAMASCSMGVDGQATMSADGRTMTGTYSGAMSGMMPGGMMGQMQSCGGAMTNGQFTLTR